MKRSRRPRGLDRWRRQGRLRKRYLRALRERYEPELREQRSTFRAKRRVARGRS